MSDFLRIAIGFVVFYFESSGKFYVRMIFFFLSMVTLMFVKVTFPK